MLIADALQALLKQQDLTSTQMRDVMQYLMSGEASDAEIAGLLIALRMKGETIDEIAAAAEVMRSLSVKVNLGSLDGLIDTCGTGGDGANIFNVSTATAFVAAAGGAKVAKHGNRSVSSKSGSADLLEAAGVNLGLTAAQVEACITELGVGFMFAPAHHGAMKHVIGVRRALGVRTVFNLLGPLTNPANAPAQVLGVYDRGLLVPFAQVLKQLGSEHVMVVHAADGLDEISVAAPTYVAELRNGQIKEWQIDPAEYGMAHPSLLPLSVASAEESLALIKQAFAGEAGPAADIIALNAGAALYVAGKVTSFADGVMRAKALLHDGLAAQKFQQFIEFTQAI
jgi:anthranilate phosphoribosyltransferase